MGGEFGLAWGDSKQMKWKCQGNYKAPKCKSIVLMDSELVKFYLIGGFPGFWFKFV